MPKRPYQPDSRPFPPIGSANWSIGSSSLTPVGQSELLKHLGRQLQAGYMDVLQEPVPTPLKQLVEKLPKDDEKSDGKTP